MTPPDLVVQKKAANDMRKSASDEARAVQQVLLHCRLDMMRECESPRFLPSMLFEDMSPVTDVIFELEFHPKVVETRFSWLIVSSLEPCLGTDKVEPLNKSPQEAV